jgi:Glycosyl transferase family 11
MQVSHIGILKTQGHGLGNQMFLIASTIGIAEAHKVKYGFAKWKNNEYFANPLPDLEPGVATTIKEKSWDYHPVSIPIDRLVYLDGYFQSHKHFINSEKTVRDTFEFKKSLVDDVNNILSQGNLGDTCSIHVRRGDYLNYPNIHPQQPKDYWVNAQKQIESKNNVDTYIVFSDDHTWCKLNIGLFSQTGKKVLFYKGRTQIDDFIGISLCKHNIITNSTFSWWAAWLNKNSNKMVIMPKLWFGSEGPWSGPTNADSLAVDGWLRL